MKICLFVEGSYPYILGGVSSWINTLIKSCPEHEFIIYSINANSKNIGKYKYLIPENVEDIINVCIDDINFIEGKKGKKYNFNKTKEDAIKGLLEGTLFSWDDIFDFFKHSNIDNVTELFMSKDFFNIVKKVYIENYPYTPFTDFIWTIRSMYLTLFYILMNELPQADIYHSVSTGYAGIVASYAKYIYNKPFILSEHGIYTREREEEIIKSDWVKGYYKELWIKYFFSLSRCAYDKADIVTSLFNTNKTLQVELGCKEEKINIIPNGVDISIFKNLEQKDGESDINIGAVVRVVPIKDIKTMIKSFEIIKNEVENTNFFIMGPTDEDSEYYDECLALVKQLNIRDIYFTGTVDIKDYIGKMDIMVLTSISEGQPLAVMEGMAAKKPFVTTNVGDCKDLLYGRDDVYGKAGFIEYIMDYNGIANSIIKLCDDENLRLQMGINGYNRVSNLYKKEDYIRTYKKIYDDFGSD